MKSRSVRVVAAGLGLSLPVLGIGLHDDDFFHRLALAGRVAEFRRDIWSLYEFVPNSVEARRLIDSGLLPWFADPELRTRFFRPLSSALIALDVKLFGDWAFPAYLHSLLWFSVALWLVARIHRSVLPERAAFWASLSYGVAGAHAATTSWIAARHVLVGTVFGLAAFSVSLGPESACQGSKPKFGRARALARHRCRSSWKSNSIPAASSNGRAAPTATSSH